MEITLQKEGLSLYETVWQKQSEAIAESDSIVPDTKPDIARILKTAGRAKITGQEILGDKIRISGEAKYTVLYAPEPESGIAAECMEVRIPFKDICALGKGGEDVSVSADAEILHTEAMLLNSRKLSLKGTVGISVEAVRQKELQLCTGVETDEAIECKTKHVHLAAPAGMGEFTITAADTLEVPGENPPIAEILEQEAHISEENVKLITGKIILKGTARLKTLYLTTVPARPLAVMHHEIPFTEILDMPGTEEGMDYMLDYAICDIYCETDDTEDGARGFGAEITMKVRAKTMQDAQLEILDDCFCPGYKTKVSYETVQTEETADVVAEEISVRKTLTLPMEYPPIAEVCDLSAKPMVTAVSLNDGEITAEGYAEAHLLYRTEDDAAPIVAFEDRIPFSFSARTHAPENAEIACRTRFGGATFTLSDAESVDVRVNMAFDIRLSGKGEVETVSEITATEETAEKKPSVVIAFTGKGDSLWSLAKKYGVSVEKIAAANGFEEEKLIVPGMRLLVPRG